MTFSLYPVWFLAISASLLGKSASAAFTEEQIADIKKQFEPILEECGTPHGVTLETLAEFGANKKQPDDADSKCFFACFFKKTGLLDSKGMYSEEVALQKIALLGNHLDKAKLEQAMVAAKTCNSVNEEKVSDGEAGCDRAKLVYDCMADQKEVFGFIF